MQADDVIVEINRKPVANANDAIAMSRDIKGRILLRVWGRGGSHFVIVEPPKSRK